MGLDFLVEPTVEERALIERFLAVVRELAQAIEVELHEITFGRDPDADTFYVEVDASGENALVLLDAAFTKWLRREGPELEARGNIYFPAASNIVGIELHLIGGMPTFSSR